MTDNKDNQNNNGNGSGNSNFVMSQIIEISKELSSITRESKVQFENLTGILKKIEKIVDNNSEITNKHSSQIEKLYSVLNQTINAIKNLKVAISMKTKSLESQMKTMVSKPKWKKLYTVLIAVGTLIALILSNLERIKSLFGG